jgi:hypothetical protein
VQQVIRTKLPHNDANGIPEPSNVSIQVPVSNAAGNWLYALIAWRQIDGLPNTTWTVSDDAHNWWDPLGAPLVTSDAQNKVRTTIWRCPAARALRQPNDIVAGLAPGLQIMAAPTGMYASGSVCIMEFQGVQPGVQDLIAAAGFAKNFTAVNLSCLVPSESVVLAVGAAADHTTTLGMTGGWSGLFTAQISNASDPNADLAAIFGYKITAAEADLSLTSTNTTALAASVCGSADSVAGPVQPSPSWPWFMLETVPGAGQSTVSDTMQWVPTPSAWLDLKSFKQGREYELSSLSTGAGSLTIDSPNGEMIPTGSQIIAGTPVRLRAYWPGGAWQAQFHGDGGTASPQIVRDWSYVAAGSPLNNTFFIVTTAQSATITPGDQFTDTNNPGTVFTVTRLSLPFAGFVNVSFTPTASVTMNNPDQVSFAGIPVVAGQRYSMAAWLGCSQPYPAGVALDLQWKAPNRAVVGDTFSPVVTTAQPQLVIASGIAPPGATRVNPVIVANGVPASNVIFSAAGTTADGGYVALPQRYTGWAGANGAGITAVAPWGYDRNGPPNVTPWYIPMSGFFERIPVTWDENFRGVVQSTVSDVWFSLQENMRSVLLAELLNDGPYALWPCTDPTGSGSIGASNAAPANPIPMSVETCSLGAGGASSTFGANSNAILGAGSTLLLNSLFRVGASSGMWQVVMPSGSGTGAGQGISLTARDSNYPPIAGGITAEIWFQVNSGGPLEPNNCPMLLISNVAGQGFSVYLDAPVSGGGTGKVFLDKTGTNKGTGGAAGQGLGATVFHTATNPPLCHVVVAFNRTTYTVYVNGNQAATGSWTNQLPKTFQYVTANGVAGSPIDALSQSNAGYQIISFSAGATVGWCAIYPTILSPTRITTHYQAGATAMSGEAPGNRLERLIQNSSDAQLRRCIQQDTGTWLAPVVSMQDVVSSPLSDALTHITSSALPGVLAVAPTGDVFYLSRQNAYNQPPKWVLGENIQAGEYPVLPMPVFGSDPTKIVNQIQLTQLDRQSVTAPQVPAIEQASAGQVGTITFFQSGYLLNDSQSALNAGPGLLDLANWLATTFSVPRLRVDVLQIDAAGHPANWPFVLGAAVGDMATANRRPETNSQGATGAPVLSVTGRVVQTTRSFSFGYQKQVTARCDILLDPAPEANILTTGDPVRGLLNGQNVLAW